ncbi:hypothetical protein [Rhizobium sp. 60-20]|uniref:hypothetical protein n=1 Tax=Rhizobium sp. 60-20 TaxID=1895819 RepID=UPI0009299F20|nr:hypothetical protein [Rhizobium sp. 60-20]OJY66435.1 MAG: hypothetical protein BGP09_31415 [Rhizobium sp. 60-20]
MKKLKAPIGADGANIGTKLFPIDAEGNVTVPDEAAQTLVGVGGFQILVDIPEAPEGFTVLQSTSGSQGCSFGTECYATDENGYVTVPTGMVGELLSHGFIVALPTEPKVIAEPAPPVVEPVATPEQFVSEEAPTVDLPLIPLGTPVGEIPAFQPEASEQPATSGE